MSLQSERIQLLMQRLSLTDMVHGYEALAVNPVPLDHAPPVPGATADHAIVLALRATECFLPRVATERTPGIVAVVLPGVISALAAPAPAAIGVALPPALAEAAVADRIIGAAPLFCGVAFDCALGLT